MAIVTVGIDLAKNVFAAHGVNEAGKPEIVRPGVSRARLLELIAHLLPAYRHESAPLKWLVEPAALDPERI